MNRRTNLFEWEISRILFVCASKLICTIVCIVQLYFLQDLFRLTGMGYVAEFVINIVRSIFIRNVDYKGERGQVCVGWCACVRNYCFVCLNIECSI